MKYYYTDPLAAAWMAKHFGMQFCDISGHNLEIRDNYDGFLAGGRFPKRAFVRQDSLYLLMPQERDLGSLNDFQGKIIQRDGIPFMWPLEE